MSNQLTLFAERPETKIERCQRILGQDSRLKLASQIKPFCHAEAATLARGSTKRGKASYAPDSASVR